MVKISLKDVILELQPFSDELVDWCKSNKEFFDALKNIYPDKFISPAMIMVTKPPNGDEIIGIYNYSYKQKTPIFKQDFIINVNSSNKIFILYTRNPNGSSKYVKDINEFYDKYAKYGYKKSDHHLTLDELPIELQPRAKRSIELSKKVNIKNIPQAQIETIYEEVMAIKRKDRFEKVNLP